MKLTRVAGCVLAALAFTACSASAEHGTSVVNAACQDAFTAHHAYEDALNGEASEWAEASDSGYPDDFAQRIEAWTNDQASAQADADGYEQECLNGN